MDIQISSNFERLLFEASGRNPAEVTGYMNGLKQSGSFTIAPATLEAIRAEFSAGRASMAETDRTIEETLAATGYLLDPHTATAVKVAAETKGDVPMIVLATAHPAKFPDAVQAASGRRPELPVWLGDLMDREERFTTLPSDVKMVKEYISRHSRAALNGNESL
jgi:threonine synthase